MRRGLGISLHYFGVAGWFFCHAEIEDRVGCGGEEGDRAVVREGERIRMLCVVESK
jgi:hypothetical protein